MVEWRISSKPVSYPDAVAEMEARVEAIGRGDASELVWLLEHPPLYTAGTSAMAGDLLSPDRFPVYRTGRGGQFTYHGPGQRVAYAMLDLSRRGRDVRAYVCRLEDWIIATLARFAIKGERRAGRIGIWVERPPAPGGAGMSDPAGAEPLDDKIAAIGVRVRRWVAYHGIAINVAPELEHFSGIVPCGIQGHGVTSLAALGHAIPMAAFDAALIEAFGEVFDGRNAGACVLHAPSARVSRQPLTSQRPSG
ncbi:MAG: lipoyl(octanoyl) transferase LipB [Proteobacteria bacterium]|nr:lipoyl(octanoyl) transferase LipB [Pseudomonadota bacterium]